MKTHKTCPGCKRFLPLEDFRTDKRRLDGRGTECKACASEYHKKYSAKNRARLLEQKREYYQSHKAQLTEKFKKYYQSFRDWYLEYHHTYHAKNVDEIKERKKKYISNHHENYIAYGARRRAKKAGNGGSFTGKEWKELCQQYGNKCLMCKRDNVPLTADHVIPVVLGGTNNIDNIQPLCQCCNSRKGTKILDLRY